MEKWLLSCLGLGLDRGSCAFALVTRHGILWFTTEFMLYSGFEFVAVYDGLQKTIFHQISS